MDAMPDVAEEPIVCADAGVASCADAAVFRAPALFSSDAGAPCPQGYDSHDLILATPQSATCACQCSDGGAPGCSTNVHWNGGTTDCSQVDGGFTASGTCAPISLTLVAHEFEVDPPVVVGGCGGGTSIAPALTQSNVRLCVPRCASDESVCSANAGLRACLYGAGNIGNCPSTYPSGPFYVGASPTGGCDTCSCTATGDCSKSHLHLYSDNGCSNNDTSFNMDGTCNNSPNAGVLDYGSAKINATFSNYACTVSPPGASHVVYTPSTDYTVCCQ
jgi:hypothetical protein